MINMPSGATVLDFAYSIHTDIGNQCIGANINHRLVPLGYKLISGDQVEVITSKVQTPQEEWYKYVVTARAKTRIANAIRNTRKEFKKNWRREANRVFQSIKYQKYTT